MGFSVLIKKKLTLIITEKITREDFEPYILELFIKAIRNNKIALVLKCIQTFYEF